MLFFLGEVLLDGYEKRSFQKIPDVRAGGADVSGRCRMRKAAAGAAGAAVTRLKNMALDKRGGGGL